MINNGVIGKEATTEGCEGYEGDEVKDDDVGSIDFLFDDDNDVDEALHLPPRHTSYNIVEENEISLSDLFSGEEEKEKE